MRSRSPLISFLAILGPGLVTGAADDDPSGIATYSQVGAQFGYSMGWTMLFAFPLMAAIQEISARIGSTTGHGIATNLRRHYPRWLLTAVLIAFSSPTSSISAPISPRWATLQRLFLPGPHAALDGGNFRRSPSRRSHGSAMRAMHPCSNGLTLSLFAYVATVFRSACRLGRGARRALLHAAARIHRRQHDGAGRRARHDDQSVSVLLAIVAGSGRAAAAAQEAAFHRAAQRRQPNSAASASTRWSACSSPTSSPSSSSVAMAATLHTHGIHAIDTSVQAAQALKPIAGTSRASSFAARYSSARDLLALPVLAGSASYAVCETFRWNTGLDDKPKRRAHFMASSRGATRRPRPCLLAHRSDEGALLEAVVNGVLAAPLMAVMMLISSNPASWAGWSSAGNCASSAGSPPR